MRNLQKNYDGWRKQFTVATEWDVWRQGLETIQGRQRERYLEVRVCGMVCVSACVTACVGRGRRRQEGTGRRGGVTRCVHQARSE